MLRHIGANEPLRTYFYEKIILSNKLLPLIHFTKTCRYKYDPVSTSLKPRIPNVVEELFAKGTSAITMSGLKTTSKKDDVWTGFAGRIVDCGSTTIYLKTGAGVPWDKVPCSQFKYRCAAFPGVMLEVSSDQNK